eukprot:7390452-Prymnesium_polylepis.1
MELADSSGADDDDEFVPDSTAPTQGVAAGSASSQSSQTASGSASLGAVTRPRVAVELGRAIVGVTVVSTATMRWTTSRLSRTTGFVRRRARKMETTRAQTTMQVIPRPSGHATRASDVVYRMDWCGE